MGHTDDNIDVLVIGAGLAGMTAAATAARAGARVTVVDTRSPGGRARTDHHDGFAFNQGPHALYLGGEATRVLGRLGLDLAGGTPPQAGSYAEWRGRAVVLPVGPWTMMRTPLLGGRSKVRLVRFLQRLPKLSTDGLGTLSVNQWLDETDLADDARNLVGALIRVATYQTDFDGTSADAIVRQLQLALATGVR